MTIDSNNADTIEVPSTPSNTEDHWEVHRTIPSTPVHLNNPQPICHSACPNKGIPPMHPDEDLKLEQGSRSHTREAQAPIIQNMDIIPVGDGCVGESSLHIDD